MEFNVTLIRLKDEKLNAQRKLDKVVKLLKKDEKLIDVSKLYGLLHEDSCRGESDVDLEDSTRRFHVSYDDVIRYKQFKDLYNYRKRELLIAETNLKREQFLVDNSIKKNRYEYVDYSMEKNENGDVEWFFRFRYPSVAGTAEDKKTQVDVFMTEEEGSWRDIPIVRYVVNSKGTKYDALPFMAKVLVNVIQKYPVEAVKFLFK